MKIACGFDHAGFPLKESVLDVLREEGHEVLDLGTDSTEPVDYPDIAVDVGEAVRSGGRIAGCWCAARARASRWRRPRWSASAPRR